MLHSIPDSPHRARLLEVMELQSRLLNELCALKARSTVDLPWLQALWHELDAGWVRKFWENDSGKRQHWLQTVAAASKADKQQLLSLHDEQQRFPELYTSPATLRLTRQSWAAEPFASAKALLNAFYAPLFYKDEGFPNTDGTRFHKDHFIGHPPPKVCPYTDNTIQDTKLDHFLPKDDFPMLSLHPDNLIPCSTDPNSLSHKGRLIPLDPTAPDQAANWFHPRQRPATGTYRLDFPEQRSPNPTVRFIAHAAEDQPRLDNLDRLFDVTEFWGRMLDDELQLIAGEFRDESIKTASLDDEATEAKTFLPDPAVVIAYLDQAAKRAQRRIGRDGLAIVKSAYYAHIAQTPRLLEQVIRLCNQGT